MEILSHPLRQHEALFSRLVWESIKDEVFAVSMHTCVTRIVSYGQRVSVVVRVH